MEARSIILGAIPRSRPRTAKDSPTRCHPPSLEDGLVESAKKGDAEAFARLIERHKRFCLSKAYSILRNRDDAEDDVQTGLMQAWRHLGSYRGRGSFGAWLGRIVSNQCLMRLREAKLAQMTSVDEIFNSEGSFRLEVIDQRAVPEETLGDEQVSLVLKKEIRGIPPLLRKVLVMRDVDQFVMRDIAAHLGITIPAAKSRLLRARMELRRRLLKHLGAKGCGTMLQKSDRQRTAYVRST